MDLKELRNSKFISQKELAKKINVNPSTLSGWESGRSPVPDDKKAEIADILQVSPSTIETPYERIKSKINYNELLQNETINNDFKETLYLINKADEKLFPDFQAYKALSEHDLTIDFRDRFSNILQSIKRFTEDMIDYNNTQNELLRLRIETSRQMMIHAVLEFQSDYYEYLDCGPFTKVRKDDPGNPDAAYADSVWKDLTTGMIKCVSSVKNMQHPSKSESAAKNQPDPGQ